MYKVANEQTGSKDFRDVYTKYDPLSNKENGYY